MELVLLFPVPVGIVEYVDLPDVNFNKIEWIKIFNKDNKILMIQRKNSIAYIEFLRGKYDIYNINYIQLLINKCNFSPLESYFFKDFNIIWNL